MTDTNKMVQWQSQGRMTSLEKYARILPTDRAKVEVGIEVDLVKGAHTRVLVEVQREIGQNVYFYSKIFHPKELLDSGAALGTFRNDASEYFDQMRRKEHARAH